MNKSVIIVSVMITLVHVSSACLGSGCRHDRDRDQFFWCSGHADSEISSIKSFFGGLNRNTYEQYCTGISAMIVTRDPSLLAVAERHCGPGHEVICHEDISFRN